MSRNEDKPDGDEAFFSRWSRRKQQIKSDVKPAPQPDTATKTAVHERSPPSTPSPAADASQPREPAAPDDKTRPLTEDDFKHVDFTKLDYNSDYAPFLDKGVPESVRQKALTQLWHSDTVFTQVDPFQDYAGDFTDAALVPANGILKTAYRVGQGFLNDREAYEWDRLGKPDVAPAIAALPELRPGYRVRRATADDATALVEVQTAAITRIAADLYGAEVATSWAHGLTTDLITERLAAGAIADVAIDETSGTIVAVCAREARDIVALFVAPVHGRRGLARRLLERAIADLETPDARGTINAAATRLSRPIFARLGWRYTGTRLQRTRGGIDLEVFDMVRSIVSPATLTIASETPDQPVVRAFFAASEVYMGALYPAESNHFVGVETLLQPNVIFLVARLAGEPVGCGAVVRGADGSGEIKRMWVVPEARGLKLGVKILEALEAAARRDGIDVLRLETGIHQPEAIGLYRRAGFVEIAAFGDYTADPLSIFMEKRIAADYPSA